MDRVHGAAPHFKGAVKLRRFVLDEEGAAERRAFEQGRTAAIDGLPMLAQPYRALDLREAWFRGWRFMGAALAGLRPIDTVRRKS